MHSMYSPEILDPVSAARSTVTTISVEPEAGSKHPVIGSHN